MKIKNFMFLISYNILIHLSFVIQKNNADFCCLYFDLLNHLWTDQISYRMPFLSKYYINVWTIFRSCVPPLIPVFRALTVHLFDTSVFFLSALYSMVRALMGNGPIPTGRPVRPEPISTGKQVFVTLPYNFFFYKSVK